MGILPENGIRDFPTVDFDQFGVLMALKGSEILEAPVALLSPNRRSYSFICYDNILNPLILQIPNSCSCNSLA